MKKINYKKKDWLLGILPFLTQNHLDKQDETKCVYVNTAISVHKKWLTESEAESEVMNYLDAEENKDFMDLYIHREKKIIDFFIALADKSECFLCEEDYDSGNVACSEFDSVMDLADYCTKLLRDDDTFILAYPQLKSVIVNSYDMTLIAYATSMDYLNKVVALSKNSELFEICRD